MFGGGIPAVVAGGEATGDIVKEENALNCKHGNPF